MKFKLNFKARHAGMAALVNIAVLGALVLFNLLVQNFPAQWDMTRKKLFSLTEPSLELIEALEKDVMIYLLAVPGQEPKDIQEVLERYAAASSLINLETLDPDRNPGLIERYSEEGQTVNDGSVIVVSGEYSRIIDRMDLYSISRNQQGQAQILGMTVEQRVSSALSYVTTGREPKVYVLEGHNEYSLEALSLDNIIKKANFNVETLNLLKMGKVPSDADAVLILSPDWDITGNESDALAAYLEKGGALFVSLDLNDSDMRHTLALLERYNLELMHGIVMEKDTNRLLAGMGNNTIFFSPRLTEENPITTPLIENKLDAFVFTAMGVRETETRKRNLEFTPLMSSSNSSWLRKDMSNPSEFRTAADIPGPITVAASLAQKDRDTGKENGAKIVILTSGKALASMPGLGQIKANIEFLISSLGWLTGQEDAVNISSKSLFRLSLRLSATQAWIYAGICMILIPLIIIITASVVLVRRKQL